MSFKQIEAVIDGISPLLMHAFPLAPISGIEKMTAEEQAEHAAYRDPDGKLYIPAVNLQRAFVAGAAFSKGKGRATLAKVAAACLLVTPERLQLSVQEYTVDSRPVVVPATKGRIVRHRPRFDKWSVGFTLEYDPTLLSADQVRAVVDDTGTRVGLLDFRPACKGPFGRFSVVSWQG